MSSHGADLSVGNASKHRELCDASVTATTQLPAWPPTVNSVNRKVFEGDMKGCELGGFDLVVTNWATLTSIDVTFQTSVDGVVWSAYKAMTQATADTTERVSAKVADGNGERFWRASIVVVGSGSATVHCGISYSQKGPRGAYAPPGAPVRN